MGFDKKKTLNVVLYMLKETGKTDFLRIFKILYFADRDHLVKYGIPIIGDSYVAMRNGPVPSKLYDLLKALRDDFVFNVDTELIKSYITVTDNHFVEAMKECDIHELSKSEMDALDNSIRDNQSLNFNKLSEKSHGYAWKKANENNEMTLEDIAKEGGANKEMIKYMNSLRENESIFQENKFALC